METPLGLTYRPVFPSIQSLMAQMGQMRALEQKQAAEEKKNAQTRAYQAVADYAKYHPDRPYVKALEPFFQKQAEQGFEIMRGVKNGEVDPSVLQEHMIRMGSDADKAKRYDAEVQSFMKQWKDSGVYNDDYILKKYADHTIDLNSTQYLGVVTSLAPDQVDPNNFVNDVILDRGSYNERAMADAFIAELMKSEGENTLDRNYTTGNYEKNKTLKSSLISKKPGSSGQQTLEFGPEDGDQSRRLLNAFRVMGGRYNTVLELRAAEKDPNFKKLKPGSDEWGVAMQKSLREMMSENGRVPSDRSLTPMPEDNSNKYDKTYIGGNQKIEEDSIYAAKIIKSVIDGETKNLGFFKGPNVNKVESKDGKLILQVKPSQMDLVAGMMAASDKENGTKYADYFNKDTGRVEIDLIPENRIELLNLRNFVGSKNDWSDIYVDQAWNKLYTTEEVQEAPAPAKEKPPYQGSFQESIDKIAGRKEDVGYVFPLYSAPSAADKKALLDSMAPGSAYQLVEGGPILKK